MTEERLQELERIAREGTPKYGDPAPESEPVLLVVARSAIPELVAEVRRLREAKAYGVYRTDGTSMGAYPKLVGVTTDRAIADAYVRERQGGWDSLDVVELSVLPPPAKP